jgi:hypothetical protein
MIRFGWYSWLRIPSGSRRRSKFAHSVIQSPSSSFPWYYGVNELLFRGPLLFPGIKDIIRDRFHARFLGSYFLDKKRMAFFLVLVIIAWYTSMLAMTPTSSTPIDHPRLDIWILQSSLQKHPMLCLPTYWDANTRLRLLLRWLDCHVRDCSGRRSISIKPSESIWKSRAYWYSKYAMASWDRSLLELSQGLIQAITYFTSYEVSIGLVIVILAPSFIFVCPPDVYKMPGDDVVAIFNRNLPKLLI